MFLQLTNNNPTHYLYSMIYDSLIHYIQERSQSPLTSSDIALIRESFVYKKLRKRQFFLQEGDICKHFGFIVKGAMRQYVVDEKGVEHIVRVGVENWWMGDRESWVNKSPSVYNIDAWEQTEMLIIDRTNTLSLIKKVPAFREMIRLLDERNNIANQRRLTSAISNTAEKRYTPFVSCYPELLGRFPQHIIASYLGITQQSLSRIRRNVR